MSLLHDSSRTSAIDRDTPRNRMAVYYRRRIAGRFCTSIEVTPSDTAYLSAIGLLDPEHARDKTQVSLAIGRLLTLLQRQSQPAPDVLDPPHLLGTLRSAALEVRHGN